MALRTLASEWALEPGEREIVWRWDTAQLHANAPADAEQIELGRTEFEPGGERIVVTLPAAKFLAEPRWASAVIVHEAVHALHGSITRDAASYELVPAWFREGFALRVSGEGPERVRDAIALQVLAGGAPEEILRASTRRGVDAPRFSPAAAYLLVEVLEERVDPARFRRELRAVFAGREFWPGWQAALGRSTSTSESTLASLVLAARAKAESMLDEARLARLHATFRRRAPDELLALLAERPDGPLAATLRYRAASELFKRAESKHELGRVVDVVRPLTAGDDRLWMPEALVLLGRAEARRGRLEAARRAWRRVRESFADDRTAGAVAARLLRRPDDA